jgi:type IV pilus assembly protein PilY1
LPANVRFGFAGSTGGSTNIHEIMCFQATPTNTSQSSAGLNQKQTAKVQIGTQVYFAFYNPATLAGSLTSQYLDQDVTNPNLLSIDSAITWDASCVLTGAAAGACDPPNGPAGMVPVQPWGYPGRTILTWDGSNGVPFEWTSLQATEQAALDAGDAAAALAAPPNAPPLAYSRLNYLRGNRGDEQTPASATTFTGVFRDRTSVLGDIVNSSPTWVGPPSAPYPATWNDALQGSLDPMNENSGGATPYTVFASSGAGGFQTRTNVVYAGANDGFLHGFRSGNYDNTNTYVKANNDGTEVLAFMPRHIARTIQTASGPAPAVYNSVVNFSDPQYGHKFDVDAPPGTGDLFYSNTWHTWWIGGLGAGGPAIYALDVTDPDNTFTEGSNNAKAVVRGEWTNYSITCVNVTGAPPGGCSPNLGNTYGVPQIRRFHNGSWGAVFGNGFGSASGDAGIFVMLVDQSGAITFYYLSTGKGTGTAASPCNSNCDGISYTTPADLDGDHIVDYVYAGDLLGNVWRFDLTSATPGAWAVTPNPLFTTPPGQPITTKVAVASVAGTGNPRVMIEFGTGQQTPGTNYSGATYSTATQALYGIWDWNMGKWNSASTAQYDSLVVGTTAPTAPLSGISQLLAQSIVTTTAATQANTGTDYRTVTNYAPCWADNSGCTGASRQYGWYIPLVSGNAYPTDPAVPQNGNAAYAGNPMVYEQIIFSPVLDAGAFIVNTTIPPATSAIMCLSTTASGYTMAINPATGGSFNNSFFSFLDTTGKLNFLNVNSSGTNIPVSGIALGGTGSASIVVSGTQDYLITQTVSGVGAIEAVNPPGGTKGSRLTWIQRR